MSSISIKGVLLGALFDIVVTVVLSFIVVFAYGVWVGMNQPDQVQLLTESPGIYLATFAVAALVSIIAGYLAARIAGKGEVINGTLAILISTIIAVVVCLLTSLDTLGLMDVLTFIASPLLGTLGGYLRFRQVN